MKKFCYLLLTLNYLILTACGQSGPLYLPSDQQAPKGSEQAGQAPIPTTLPDDMGEKS